MLAFKRTEIIAALSMTVAALSGCKEKSSKSPADVSKPIPLAVPARVEGPTSPTIPGRTTTPTNATPLSDLTAPKKPVPAIIPQKPAKDLAIEVTQENSFYSDSSKVSVAAFYRVHPGASILITGVPDTAKLDYTSEIMLTTKAGKKMEVEYMGPLKRSSVRLPYTSEANKGHVLFHQGNIEITNIGRTPVLMEIKRSQNGDFSLNTGARFPDSKKK